MKTRGQKTEPNYAYQFKKDQILGQSEKGKPVFYKVVEDLKTNDHKSQLKVIRLEQQEKQKDGKIVYKESQEALLSVKERTKIVEDVEVKSTKPNPRSKSTVTSFRINPNKTKLRKQWTDEEDKKVFELVQEYGRNWKVIEGFMEGRSSKQIRERFLNNLDPEINRSKFTAQEDKIILEQYRIYGPKWSEIAKMLDRRPENQVKNRFYSYIKRVSMLEEKSDDEDNDGESSISEQPHIPPPIQIYQPLETIQSIKEEHDNTKNDSLKNESFINVQNRTPSNRIQPSINLIQGLDSFDSKQFDGIHSQDISPFHQRRILNEYSPINFEYANHHPTFDNIQEDVKELRSQIECISLEKIN
ncbi:unnamed protein product [Paramecium primaurelia]|uniref:Myb-like DNA-binding domain containing protein n=1 Tax=Paramecium primaurelia TaxID=5886 RepID=A0A8S1MGL7_PARPR|nr:unnamed protein product [Paramecium primaurelia]